MSSLSQLRQIGWKMHSATSKCKKIRPFLFCIWITITVIINKHSTCVFTHRYNNYDRALAHAIESQVINWSNIIQKILKEDSSDLLITGSNPGPDAELKFWASRKANIQNVCDQVCSPLLKTMIYLIFIS